MDTLPAQTVTESTIATKFVKRMLGNLTTKSNVNTFDISRMKSLTSKIPFSRPCFGKAYLY